MNGTIFHVALLIWSGLFIIAGAMLVIASQLGHLAESVAAAGRADRPPPGAGRTPRGSGRATGPDPACDAGRMSAAEGRRDHGHSRSRINHRRRGGSSGAARGRTGPADSGRVVAMATAEDSRGIDAGEMRVVPPPG